MFWPVTDVVRVDIKAVIKRVTQQNIKVYIIKMSHVYLTDDKGFRKKSIE